ncbi:MAG: AAA family ATPase [Candidatus Acidiferrales bacterium]
MLTAAVVGSDKTSTAALRAILTQTNLVYSVREWDPSLQNHPPPGEAIPDVVVLDLPPDPSGYLDFAADLRRLRPTIYIVACSAATPEPGLLMRAMRSGVQDFILKPITSEKLCETLYKIAEGKASDRHAPEKVIVVTGSKGGVGTSTVTVSLGVQIAQITKRSVLLLDFGRPLGHISLMLDLQPRFTLRDAMENLDRLDEHFLGGLVSRHQSGVEILAGATRPEEWQRFNIAGFAAVASVAQGKFDYVLIDGGVQDPSEWSPILRTARAILLVAEPSLLSLWTLERYISTAESAELNMDRYQVVINRWRRNDDNALRNVEERLHRPIHARLPNDYRQVSDAVTRGMPISGNDGNALVTRYRQLATDLIKETVRPSERGNSFMNRFAPVR